MSENLNLKKDKTSKSRSNKKSIIGIVIGLVVIVIIVVGVCLYINAKEVDAFNKEVNVYNNLREEIKSNKTESVSQFTEYATLLGNASNSFANFEKDSLIGSKNKNMAKNDSEIAEYIEYKEKFVAELYGLINSYNQNATPSPSQIQEVINKVENLLTTDSYIKLSTVYNSSSYVQSQVPSSMTPEGIKALLNEFISKLSVAQTGESFANNISNYFGEQSPFGYNSNFNQNNNESTTNNSSNLNNSSNTNNNSSNSNSNSNSSNSNSNNSNEPAYMQNLAALSNKYGKLVDNALDQYGNSGNLMLSGNESEDKPIIQGYYNTWNTILNDVWGDLKNNLPQSQMAELTKEEEAWVNSKNGKTSAEQAQMTERQAMKLLNKYIYQYKN